MYLSLIHEKDRCSVATPLPGVLRADHQGAFLRPGFFLGCLRLPYLFKAEGLLALSDGRVVIVGTGGRPFFLLMDLSTVLSVGLSCMLSGPSCCSSDYMIARVGH